MNDLQSLPPARSMPAHRRQAHRTIVEAAVTPTAARRRPSRRRIVVAAGAALLLTTGAAAYVASRPASDKSVVRCYTVAGLDGGDVFRGTSVSVVTRDRIVPIEDALSACARAWRDGVLVAGAAGPVDPDPRRVPAPVPPLVACTLPQGIAAVFPGDDATCRRLGLPSLEP